MTSDARLLAPGAAEGLAFAALAAAGEAAGREGRVLTVEEWDVLRRVVHNAALNLITRVEDWSDEKLEFAAPTLGTQVLHGLLGPPPTVH